MTLSSVATQKFDFFVSAGQAQTKTAPSPLTLYAISTDPVDSTHPALSGSMVYQVPDDLQQRSLQLAHRFQI